MRQTPEPELEALLEQFDCSFDENEETEETKGVTFWLSEDCVNKFAELQKRSNKKFGKEVQKLLKVTIDKMYSKVS